MAKQVSQTRSNAWGAFALEFIGSIIFLIVGLFGIWAGVFTSSVASWPTLAQIWLPILVAVAVIGSISLFFTSFSNFAGGESGKMASWAAMKTSTYTGAALVALTFASGVNNGFFLMSILGFALSFLGSGMSMM